MNYSDPVKDAADKIIRDNGLRSPKVKFAYQHMLDEGERISIKAPVNVIPERVNEQFREHIAKSLEFFRASKGVSFADVTQGLDEARISADAELRKDHAMLPFGLLNAMVRDVLRHPLNHDWTVQGFGMMRTYFGTDKRYRLNLWHSGLAVPNVSVVHDHPWHFTSWVIAGQFTNVRYSLGTLDYDEYRVSAMPPNFHCQRIKTGEGGGPAGDVSDIFLAPMQPEVYRAGDTYRQDAKEIHASFYDDGTVTINERVRVEDGEHARVFWPLGQAWVDAEPRTAMRGEILHYTQDALRKWFGEI